MILVSREPYLPIDRPKLSKSLKIDASKIQLRDAAHFENLNIDVLLSTVSIRAACLSADITGTGYTD